MVLNCVSGIRSICSKLSGKKKLYPLPNAYLHHVCTTFIYQFILRYYRNSLLFRLVNFCKKNIRIKIIFIQTELDENNFTSHVWWALIEEIAPRAKEMACEKEMACCVRGTTYTRIHGHQQLGKCLRVAGSQPTQKKFHCKNYICVKYFCPFSLYENIFTTK